MTEAKDVNINRKAKLACILFCVTQFRRYLNNLVEIIVLEVNLGYPEV